MEEIVLAYFPISACRKSTSSTYYWNALAVSRAFELDVNQLHVLLTEFSAIEELARMHLGRIQPVADKDGLFRTDGMFLVVTEVDADGDFTMEQWVISPSDGKIRKVTTILVVSHDLVGANSRLIDLRKTRTKVEVKGREARESEDW